jgi:septal ring factor EnvC (AmiA/AmiB activator)
VISFLDTTIDQTVQPAIREKAQKFTHLAVDYSKVKEERLNIDNDKILAEIEETYSKARLNDAERRIKDAEADAKEFENRLNKLVTALRVVKVVIAGSKGEEEIIFLKQIDEFLHVIATAKGDPKTLTE